MPYKDPAKKKAADKRAEEKRKKANGERHKGWTLIFYPDSAPVGWKDMLSELHLRVWVSPVHDQDKWTKADELKEARKLAKLKAETGEERKPMHKAGSAKKPHYHLVVEYPVQQDRAGFLKDFEFLNGPESVKAVKDLTAMVRYLIHADDPDKAQYKPEDVLCFGGADRDVVEQLGSHERHEALKAMRKYVKENGIVDFCDFVDYCDDCQATWARLLDDNSSYIIEKYIKSLRYKLRDAANVRVNPRTGEVIG